MISQFGSWDFCWIWEAIRKAHRAQARCWIEDIGLQLRKRHWKKPWHGMPRPASLQAVLSDREIWWTLGSLGSLGHGDLSLAFLWDVCAEIPEATTDIYLALASRTAPSTDLYGPAPHLVCRQITRESLEVEISPGFFRQAPCTFWKWHCENRCDSIRSVRSISWIS